MKRKNENDKGEWERRNEKVNRENKKRKKRLGGTEKENEAKR